MSEEVNEDIRDIGYVVVRIVEFVSIAAIIFGAAWQGTESFNLTMPQFCMLYGGIGALVSEILARILKKKPKGKGVVKD